MQLKSYLRPLVILSLPMLFYLIPLFLGYAWNTIGPGVGPANVYTQPGSYKGRHAGGYLSIDTLTPNIYNLPYDVRLRRCIGNRYLPLWNPWEALGVPFSAQGEGSPYFPLGILRSLLPQIYANYVTFLGFFLAAIFLFLFLKDMGVSETASCIGGLSFVLSGAFGAMIPVTNVVSSLSVVPFLFWAAARAVSLRTPFWRSLLSVAVAMQILAGHASMTLVILLTAAIFSLYYIRLTTVTFSSLMWETGIIMAYFALGVGLASFLVFPILESLNVAHQLAHEGLGFYFLPASHLLAFFCPLLFGHIHQGWFYINWFDLFAFAGLSIIVPVLGGISVSSWDNSLQRSMFWFFVLVALFWILRYIGFTLLNWIGSLPLFSQLSPKHANGFTVFCLCVASALAINHLQKWKLSWFISILVVAFITASSIFLLLVANTGYPNIRHGSPYIAVSVLLILSTAAVFIYAVQLANMSEKGGWQFLLFAVPAELAIYIPLGNKSLWFLYCRLGLYIFLLFTAVLSIKMVSSRYRSLVMGLLFVTFVIVYALLIRIPHKGLPGQFDLTIPPGHMLWLKEEMAIGDRTFGIRPGYQALAGIQNIDTTGPFVSEGFASFVNLIDGDSQWFKNGYFDVSLAGYDMTKYLLHRPLFDWLGVRYLVLEKVVFVDRKREYDGLVDPKNGLRVVYQDEAVTIMESATALGRAYFSSTFKSCPAGSVTLGSILQFFRSYPDCVSQTTLIEQPSLEGAPDNLAITPGTPATQLPIEISKYEPNYVRLDVDAPSAGVVVLKDAFYSGWRASVNDVEVPILRANGMVRAVMIDRPGKYVVEFCYLPSSFVYGGGLSAAVLVFLISSVFISRPKPIGIEV